MPAAIQRPRTVSEVLAEARELIHSAHLAAIEQLPQRVRRIAGYHLVGGGKAVRPALTLACATAVAVVRELEGDAQARAKARDHTRARTRARDQASGEARRRIAAALAHLDTAAAGRTAAATEDLRLLASAVLTDLVGSGGFPGRTHRRNPPSEEIGT